MDPARERSDTIATLEAALIRLKESMSVRLIPPEGASFGYAMRGARDRSAVVAIRGGIRDEGGLAQPSGPCSYDTDEPAVRIILTAMKFDPMMRSAAVLRFSERTLAVLEDDLFLECASFSTGPKKPGISTMDWGIAFSCKDGVPDVIYEKTTDPAQSRLVIFGEDPADVANNIIICSNRI
jgi:thiamine-phosphate diphosphorylase